MSTLKEKLFKSSAKDKTPKVRKISMSKQNSDWCNARNSKIMKVLGQNPLGENGCQGCGEEFSDSDALSLHLKEICPEIGFAIESSYGEAFKEAIGEGRIGVKELFPYNTDFNGLIFKQEKSYGTRLVILPPKNVQVVN